MGAHSSHHEPLDRNSRGTSFRRTASLRQSKAKANRTSPRTMDKLRRSFRSSFRRRKEPISEASKPHLWQTDEMDVRAGTCFFHVKYLGCVEVFESRGMQVCEEALRVLKNSRRRSIKAILYVSGDGLRVVEDDTKGLIVDQTIEKVSFCAPDRTHDRGFSYICRDGTTRRWMCHGFLALKESGERLSHAVGCAFAVCLERKQKRDKECSVTMNFDLSNSTFTRTGSFRQQPLTEKFQDATNVSNNLTPTVNNSASNGAIPATTVININNNINANYNRKENIPVRSTPKVSTHAIERPHASVSLLQRQNSFRGLSHLNHASPFKRQLSLRLSDLPSNAERTRSHSLELTYDSRLSNVSSFLHPKTPVSPIPELSPTHPAESDAAANTATVSDQVSAMCQQLSQGLSFLSKNDDLVNSKSNQLNSIQALSVKDIFAQKLAECSSTLVESQPLVEASTSSSFFAAEKSFADDTTLERNVPSGMHDSGARGVDGTITMGTTVKTLTENALDSSSKKHSSAEDIPLTPPATPPLLTDGGAQLPKPEQWLGKVTQSTFNDSSRATPSTVTTEKVSPSPLSKRSPALSSHMRTQSLGSAETVLSRAAAAVAAEKSSDSFNIDWASLSMDDVKPPSKNTNPFLSNSSPLSQVSDSTPVKMFEVQM